MKSYTDLEQSKKLAEIIPLESADMTWEQATNDLTEDFTWKPTMGLDSAIKYNLFSYRNGHVLPCWSISALLGFLPYHLIVNDTRYEFSMHKGLNKDGETYMIRYNIDNTDICLYETGYYNNPVDACYEMILKLKENKR